jgi:hypothetical protein
VTSTKANAGAAGAFLVTVALWLVSLVPGWATVYFAPANKPTVEPPPTS